LCLKDRVKIYNRKKKPTVRPDSLVLNPGSGLGEYANQTGDSFFHSTTKSTRHSQLGYDSPLIRNRHTKRNKGAKANSESFKINSLTTKSQNKSQNKNWENNIPNRELKSIMQQTGNY